MAPDDHVSIDRETWKEAPGIRELSMNWMVNTTDGDLYGPIHLLALRDMLREGFADVNSVVVHRSTGEKQEVSKALLPMLLKQNDNLIDQVSRLHAQVRELERLTNEQQHQLMRQGPEYQSESDPLMREWKQAAQGKDAYEKEARKWKKLYEEERHSHQRIEDELNARIEELRENLRESESSREQEAFNRKQMERRVEKMVSENPGNDGGDPAYSSSLAESYQNLSADYDALLKQFSEKSEELNSVIENRDESEKLNSERMKKMDDVLQRERREADKLRRRLAELEQAHMQVVRSYREMNDRFIRMRQSRSGEEIPGYAPAESHEEHEPDEVSSSADNMEEQSPDRNPSPF